MIQPAATAILLTPNTNQMARDHPCRLLPITTPPKPEDTTAMPPDDFRNRLLNGLGGAWPAPCALAVETRETIAAKGFTIHSITYAVEPDDRVPAFLLIPDGYPAGTRFPAIAVWHQHNGQWHLGKSEPAGLAGDAMHHTGAALAREGYLVLCPDAVGFEERQDPAEKLQGGDYERFEFLRYVVSGKCLAWKNILDMRRAIDLLASRPDVDPHRIGCYGHSMGSTHTWLVGPWEPRLKCLVGNCCLPTYAAIHRMRLLHCFPNFIPHIFPAGDTPDIAALIAPRRLHLNFGEDDAGSPIQEVRQGTSTIAAAYAKAGAPHHFSYFIEPDCGHVLSNAMWQRTKSVFAEQLSPGTDADA